MIIWIKRLFFICLGVIAMILGLIFVANNSTEVTLLFFGYETFPLDIGLWLLIVLLLGAVLGFLLAFIPQLFRRQSSYKNNKKIEALQKEVNQLRLSALKG